MNKDIKDYLHLYLGVNCRFRGQELKGKINQENLWKLFSVTQMDYGLQGTLFAMGCTHTLKAEEIYPILRPLSDMAEEEFKNLIYDCFGFAADEIYKQKDALWGRKTATKERCRMSFDLNDYYTIHVWQDFTSQDKKIMFPLIKINKFVNKCRGLSLDMDGLIESELAIDKTKLNQP